MPNKVQKTQRQKQKNVVTAVAHYSGHFPPATELEHYESICPGFAEKQMDGMWHNPTTEWS